MDLAGQLDELVVSWLVKHGAMPAWAEKARPGTVERKIRDASRRLHSRLQGVLDKGLQQLANEMERRGFPGSPALRTQLLQDLLDADRRAFQAVLADGAVEAAALGRQLTIADLQKAGMAVVMDKLPSAIVDRLLEMSFQASKETMNRIIGDIDDVLKTLAEQVRQGLGIKDAARALRDVFDGLQESRLEGIAQTEILSAQNWSGHETMRQYGVGYKQWLTSLRENVRPSHRALHGLVVRTTEPYPNGLMYPGDRSGPIGEWINCHCRERPYIPRRGEVILRTPYVP